jgi:hypothetical protein
MVTKHTAASKLQYSSLSSTQLCGSIVTYRFASVTLVNHSATRTDADGDELETMDTDPKTGKKVI